VKIWIGIVLGLGLLLNGCSSAEPKQAETAKATVTRSGNIIRFPANSPQLPRIRTGDARQDAVPRDELVAPAKVELNPGRVSRVTLPVPGRVREVLVGLGDSVRAGQALMRLESPDLAALQSSLRQAEAGISQAKATLARAEADLARAKDLLANRAIAQKEVLSFETVLAEARAGLEVAQSSREETQRRMDLLGMQSGGGGQWIAVSAPISGKVIEVTVAPGEFRSDTAQPTLTIADTSAVWVSADVPENAIRLIRPGESVSITLPSFPDQTFQGRVARIGDVVDPQTRTIKVRAEMPNPKGELRAEMFATMRHAHGTVQAVTIPKAAIYQQQDRATVFRENRPGEFEEIPVRVTWQDGERAAIESAILAGDRVVVDGITQLRAY